MPRALSSQTSSAHSIRPLAGWSPAIVRSRVVLPAPDGPAIVMHSPGATLSARSSSSTCNMEVGTGDELDGDQDGCADGEQHHGEGYRGREVGGEALVEGEWCRL